MVHGEIAQQRKALPSLKRQWGNFAAGSFLLLIAGFGIIWIFWQPGYAIRWSLLPLLIIIYILQFLWRNLPENHRLNEPELLAHLGWGNTLTLMRGVFVAGMTGFLLLPRPDNWLIWIPGILYVLSCACDFFDGFVARITNHSTRLGELLDTNLDGLGVWVASLLAVHYGQVPIWYLGVAFAYPLFLAGSWLRRYYQLPIYPLPRSVLRRVFAGLQMGFLAVILLPIFKPPGTWIAAALFALPLLTNFLFDWMRVSGLVRSGWIQTANLQIASGWLAAFLRGSILALNLALGASWLVENGFPTGAFMWLNLANALLIGMIALGILPRISAIFALSMLGFYQMYAPLSTLQIVLAGAYTVILYLGGGRYSLWTPEEILFQRHVGGQNQSAEQPSGRSQALETGA